MQSANSNRLSAPFFKNFFSALSTTINFGFTSASAPRLGRTLSKCLLLACPRYAPLLFVAAISVLFFSCNKIIKYKNIIIINKDTCSVMIAGDTPRLLCWDSFVAARPLQHNRYILVSWDFQQHQRYVAAVVLLLLLLLCCCGHSNYNDDNDFICWSFIWIITPCGNGSYHPGYVVIRSTTSEFARNIEFQLRLLSCAALNIQLIPVIHVSVWMLAINLLFLQHKKKW